MTTLARLAVSLAPLAVSAALAAQGGMQQLWANPWSNYTTVPSRSNAAPASDIEAADDFDVQGTITRVVFDSNGCNGCLPAVNGATLRFYAWANGVPGALQQETFLPIGSPGLLFDPASPETVEITLPAPFFATGKHFVSLQMHFAVAGYWEVWASGVGAYQLAPAHIRDRLTGGPWTLPPINMVMPGPLYADLTFRLIGQPAGSAPSTWVPCHTWSELPTAMPAGADYCHLRAVKAFATNDVWAVGSQTLLGSGSTGQFTTAMHWDGASWLQVPTPSPAPGPGLTNCILHAVDGAASDDVWAGGTYKTQVNGGWVGQQVFAMHWDGSAWTVPSGLPVPATSVGAGVSGSRIQDIHATATDDVWFVGDWLDIVSASSGQTTRPGLLMHWNGSSLQQTVLPIVTNVAHQYFNAVAASGPNDVWVAGGAGVPGNVPGSPIPVLFHFDGANWTHTPCPTPNHPGWWVNLTDVQVLAPDLVWVAGHSQTMLPTPQFDPFVAFWNGSTWTLMPGAPTSGALCVAQPGELYQVSSSVWKWNGAGWTATQTFPGLVNAGLVAVDALGPCELWAVGGQSRIGQVAPFAARLDAPHYWGQSVRFPSAPSRAPATLTMLAPPLLGSAMVAGIDDPANALGVPTGGTFWILGALPAPSYPFGDVVPFGGGNGGPGELFVDLAGPILTSSIEPWSAGAGTTLHVMMLPYHPSLVGLPLHTQGVVFAFAPDLALLFSNGVDLRLGF